MTTIKQTKANQKNAKLSSGPISPEGKRTVSRNRITHGILSTKLLLDHESAEDLQALVDGLQSQLKPIGTLELALVEKIAVTLWRQRRLVRAETATINLQLNTTRIANVVEKGMGLPGWGGKRFEVGDLEPPSQEQKRWCQTVISEYQCNKHLDLETLREKAPSIAEQLLSDARSEGKTIPQYLESIGINEYIKELTDWCRGELEKLEKLTNQYPYVITMAEQAKDYLGIPWNNLEVLGRYQTSLDNQLYKAINALKEAQEWRLRTLETNAVLGVDEEVF